MERRQRKARRHRPPRAWLDVCPLQRDGPPHPGQDTRSRTQSILASQYLIQTFFYFTGPDVRPRIRLRRQPHRLGHQNPRGDTHGRRRRRLPSPRRGRHPGLGRNRLRCRYRDLDVRVPQGNDRGVEHIYPRADGRVVVQGSGPVAPATDANTNGASTFRLGTTPRSAILAGLISWACVWLL